MRCVLKTWSGIFASLILVTLVWGYAQAGTRQYCVACKDPDQTYLCQVETPAGNPSDNGLQLYCIVRTSKEGGHSSCAVDTTGGANCAGPVKTYTFQAPAIPPQLRAARERLRNTPNTNEPDQSLPPQKGGEPETLIDLTGRAVDASKRGLKNTGQAVGSAAGTTKNTVGKAARGVGKGVTKAAGKVGSVTKKTGSAVGQAAQSAWDCVKSLFKDCGS